MYFCEGSIGFEEALIFPNSSTAITTCIFMILMKKNPAEDFNRRFIIENMSKKNTRTKKLNETPHFNLLIIILIDSTQIPVNPNIVFKIKVGPLNYNSWKHKNGDRRLTLLSFICTDM